MYKIGPFGAIVRESDGANIPPYKGNRDYEEYLVWVAAGNSAPIEAPPIFPKSDSERALELILKSVSVAPEDQALKDELLGKLGSK